MLLPDRRSRLHPLTDYFYDPRLWALAVFLIGLVTLDLPLHDDHSWRQGWGLMIARNFYELNFNILYPLSDLCGADSPDYFATELPLMQAIMAGLYYLFGEQVWVGRLVNWSVSCLGLWYFSRLVGMLVTPRAGFYAMLALIGSIALTFSRKLMPDTFSLFLTIIGVYQLYRYLGGARVSNLLWGGVWVALGVLCKIPSLVVVTLLIVPFLRADIALRKKVYVALATGIGGVLVGLWYFYWMPHLQEISSCFALIYPVSLTEGAQIIFHERPAQTMMRFEWNAFYSRAPYYCFIAGLALTLLRGQWRLILGSLVYTGLFVLFILKTGAVFPTHSYYVIPYIPLMALYVGVLLDQEKWLSRRVSLVAALGMLCVPLSVTLADIGLNSRVEELRLEPVLDSLGVAPESLILIKGRWGEPTAMYYSGRRGWMQDSENMDRYDWLETYREQGLEYILVDRRKVADTLVYPLMYQDSVWLIYDYRGGLDTLPD